MRNPPTAGAALADLVVALVLLALLALGSAPLAIRSAQVLEQGRALAEGLALAEGRRAQMAGPPLPCGVGLTGQDLARRATLDWRVEPADSILRLTAVFQDPAVRWRPETLTTHLRCAP